MTNPNLHTQPNANSLQHNTVNEQILELVASTLNLDKTLLHSGLTIEAMGLDSLDVLKITHAVEKHFKVSLAAFSYADVSSLEKLGQILQSALATQLAQS